MNEELLRYPTGRFTPAAACTAEQLQQAILNIQRFPEELERMMATLTDEDLKTPYRDGGWNGRQVIHHLADSHMNAYIRFKWTLTEDTPVIKAYNEKRWAETPETAGDPRLSADLLRTLHAKWTVLLKQLTTADLERAYIHPETQKHVRLDGMIQLYAWHGTHHLGHLRIIAGKR